MKKGCKLFALTCALCLLVSSSAIAAETIYTEPHDIDGNYEADLLSMGFPVSILEAIPAEDVAELLIAYHNDPTSISVSSTVMEVDNLGEIDIFVNSAYEDLISMGLTDEDISQINAQIKLYNDMTDKQLVDNLGFDKVELRLFRDALTKDDDYDLKLTDENVTASGSITTSEMTFTQSVTDTSKPLSPDVHYRVGVYFNWKDRFITTAFDDKIVVAWGGNLLQEKISSFVDYYDIAAFSGWGSYHETRATNYNEQTINAGGYYEFPQAYPNSAYQAKSGNATFMLNQTGKVGKQSKIISQFAHRVLIIGSTSISVTSTPSISIGNAYDNSTQQSYVITY